MPANVPFLVPLKRQINELGIDELHIITFHSISVKKKIRFCPGLSFLFGVKLQEPLMSNEAERRKGGRSLKGN